MRSFAFVVATVGIVATVWGTGARAETSAEIMGAMSKDVQKVIKAVDKSQARKMAEFCAGGPEKIAAAVSQRATRMAQAQEVSASIGSQMGDGPGRYYAAKCAEAKAQ